MWGGIRILNGAGTLLSHDSTLSDTLNTFTRFDAPGSGENVSLEQLEDQWSLALRRHHSALP